MLRNITKIKVINFKSIEEIFLINYLIVKLALTCQIKGAKMTLIHYV